MTDLGLQVQEQQRGGLRKTDRLRQEERTGEEMRQRLTAAMHYGVGFRDEDLIGFGINPRISCRRPASEEETPDAPAAKTLQDTPPQ